MKRIALLIGAFSLALPTSVVLPTASAVAQADPALGLVPFCRENTARTLGNCVSIITVRNLGGDGYAALLCDRLRDLFPEEFYLEWDSYAQCVGELQAEQHE